MSTARGNEGEERAVRFLERQGAAILDRNRRGGSGELDIVARLGELLLFVEVKFHRDYDSGLLAMHADKRRRLVSAAQSWRLRHTELASLQCRFDLIILTPRRGLFGRERIELHHLPDAFRP